MNFKFKVSSFRNQYEAPDGRRLCVFTTPVSNIPAEWEEWRDVNVRDTNVRSDVFNAIVDTLRNEPEEMIFRNLGITILAPEVDFDNKTNEVTVVFTDKARHGIANGGHTFSAIREVLRMEHVDAEVKVECIVGDLETDTRVSIVDGRNRSRSVQAFTLKTPGSHMLQLSVLSRALTTGIASRTLNMKSAETASVKISRFARYSRTSIAWTHSKKMTIPSRDILRRVPSRIITQARMKKAKNAV